MATVKLKQPHIYHNFYLNYHQREYLQTCMGQVSRTFALVTPCFEEPLDALMSTAYLIFRVADNIEDCRETYAEQQIRFQQFRQLLEQPNLALEILQEWAKQSWSRLDTAQQQLMQPEGGLMLWQIYASIPEQAKQTIQHWACEMVAGVEQYLNPFNPYFICKDNIQVLASLADYNHYCYIVAGTVGHMGTELAIQHYQLNDREANLLLDTCEACGNALQKTNIIKDFLEDLRAGFCYLPQVWMDEVNSSPLALQGATKDWIGKVIQDAVSDLNQSVAYVLDIPYRAVGYRLASLMCLLPAYQTLLLAAQRQPQLFTPAHSIKISRQCFSESVENSKRIVKDNNALQLYVANLQREIETALH